MLRPSEQEMVEFLRFYQNAEPWRVPKRLWQEIWYFQRGHFNERFGVRRFPTLRKRQLGVLHPIGFWGGGAGTVPELTDITHSISGATPIRIHVRWFTDGGIQWDTGGTVGSIVYAQMTTGTDDANDHTNEWWPDHPDTDEGLNWDIRYTGTFLAAGTYSRFNTGSGDRIENTWYLLDTVSDDSADGSNFGAFVVRKIAKNTGSSTYGVSIEIRATGSGSAVASQVINLNVTVV